MTMTERPSASSGARSVCCSSTVKPDPPWCGRGTQRSPAESPGLFRKALMFLPQTPRADPQPREAGELGEEPYDKVARHHHELSPRTCGSIHEINHNTHLLTPRLEGGISSMISCAVSPAAEDRHGGYGEGDAAVRRLRPAAAARSEGEGGEGSSSSRAAGHAARASPARRPGVETWRRWRGDARVACGARCSPRRDARSRGRTAIRHVHIRVRS
jgi:hypothetical protein